MMDSASVLINIYGHVFFYLTTRTHEFIIYLLIFTVLTSDDITI